MLTVAQMEVRYDSRKNMARQTSALVISPLVPDDAPVQEYAAVPVPSPRGGESVLPSPRPLWMDAADEWSIPYDVAQALLEQESGFDPLAVSSAGAMGIAQVMPETGRSVAVELGLVERPEDFDPTILLRDPQLNLRIGFYYLRRQWDRFGSLELALAAYNAGPGAVQKYGGVPPYPETEHYVASILALKERYQ